jgi:hypothetical protein
MTMKKQAELVVGFICVVLWILLFGAGMMVPSETYRKSLEQSFIVSNFLIAGLLYTYTNVAMLTCLAGLIAGISSRLTFREYEVDKALKIAPKRPPRAWLTGRAPSESRE